MKRKQWVLGPLAVGCTLGLAGLALSQTRLGAQPGGQPGGGRPDFGRPDGGRPDGGRPDFRNMTPQQREQMFRQFTERRLRDELTRTGFSQKTIQDPVVHFALAQATDRRVVGEKAGKLREALANKASDAQISAALSGLRAAQKSAKQRRDKGLKDLNAKIAYSKKPRLDAVLTLAGIVGDGPLMGGRGFGGRGGFGGPRDGGGRRGFGGPGGPGGR